MAEEYFVDFELEDDITVDESDLGLDELWKYRVDNLWYHDWLRNFFNK